MYEIDIVTWLDMKWIVGFSKITRIVNFDFFLSQHSLAKKVQLAEIGGSCRAEERTLYNEKYINDRELYVFFSWWDCRVIKTYYPKTTLKLDIKTLSSNVVLFLEHFGSRNQFYIQICTNLSFFSINILLNKRCDRIGQ